MKGDFSRFTFDPKKHYSAVRLQQGRVQLDADWNEQLDISQHRLAAQMSDFIGYSGVPEGDNAGFEITTDGSILKIGAGRIYVAGELYENEEVELDFTAQPDYPGVTLPTEEKTYVAYLDVWQRHITPLEDPNIGEVALGGADTATRVKNVWQVKLVQGNITTTPPPPDWKPTGVEPISTGRMTAQVATAGAALENQLYRVEIHKSSQDGDPTFKWSRDNGAVAARVTNIDSTSKTITVNSAGRDPEMGFAPQQRIELRSEEQTLKGEAGTLYELTAVQGNELTVHNSSSLPAFDNKTWIVRRWDSQEQLPLVSADNWATLENEIQVQFEADKTYNTGDYWLIPARTLTGEIEWPTDNDGFQPPHGIRHHYVPLAVLTWNSASWEFNNDLRTTFNPLIGGFVNKAGDTMTGPLTIQPSPDSVGLTVMGQVGIGTGSVNGDVMLDVAGKIKATEFEGKGLGKWEGSGNIYYDGGNVGIGTNNSQSKLSVSGGVGIGSSYAGTDAAPPDGLIVEGNVGIGTNNPGTEKLKVVGDTTLDGTLTVQSPHEINLLGNVGIGTNNPGSTKFYVSGSTVLAGTLTVQSAHETHLLGNVGIGTSDPKSMLSVSGGVGIGSSYAGNNPAPSNGLIVEGQVGIGTISPASDQLKVVGNTTLDGALTVTNHKTNLQGGLNVTGSTTLGATTLNGILTVESAYQTNLQGGLNVTGSTILGATTLNGILTVKSTHQTHLLGQVGIGTTAPAMDTMLDVAGAIKAESFKLTDGNSLNIFGTNVVLDFAKEQADSTPITNLVQSVNVSDDGWRVEITMVSSFTMPQKPRVIFHQDYQYTASITPAQFDVMHIDQVTISGQKITVEFCNLIEKDNIYLNFSLLGSTAP